MIVAKCTAGCCPAAGQIGDNKGLFPLRVEVSKRYLVDGADRPFLIHGDTAWSLIVQLSREELELYLDDRCEKGFNATTHQPDRARVLLKILRKTVTAKAHF